MQVHHVVLLQPQDTPLVSDRRTPTVPRVVPVPAGVGASTSVSDSGVCGPRELECDDCQRRSTKTPPPTGRVHPIIV